MLNRVLNTPLCLKCFSKSTYLFQKCFITYICLCPNYITVPRYSSQELTRSEAGALTTELEVLKFKLPQCIFQSFSKASEKRQKKPPEVFYKKGAQFRRKTPVPEP